MKANELMVGDLVKIKDQNKLFSMRIVPEHFVRSLEDFEPIPLTKEILNANGFEKHTLQYDDDHIIFWNEANEHLLIYSLAFGKKDPNINITVKFAHQLQQTLRLVGLHELADNFKIQ